MPGDISSSEGARWTRVIERTRVTPSQPAAVKLRGKHIALFVHEGEVLACNNRCPHEGYPLVEGALDANCVLTCHWHNWKFDLRSGEFDLRSGEFDLRSGEFDLQIRSFAKKF